MLERPGDLPQRRANLGSQVTLLQASAHHVAGEPAETRLRLTQRTHLSHKPPGWVKPNSSGLGWACGAHHGAALQAPTSRSWGAVREP